MAATLILLALLAPAVLAQNSVISQLQSSEFTGFSKLLEHADVIPVIESALASGKPLTIFAPTDDALLHNTSPTLLAFLKLKENKAALRKLLLSHFVSERLSPFKWAGAHTTIEGTNLKLSMDTSAFYANDVAVKQYNALVSDVASVHSVPTLLVPTDMAIGVKTYVEESTQVRRVLQADAYAPATAPSSDEPPITPAVPGSQTINNGAGEGHVASVLAMGAAVAAAMLF